MKFASILIASFLFALSHASSNRLRRHHASLVARNETTSDLDKRGGAYQDFNILMPNAKWPAAGQEAIATSYEVSNPLEGACGWEGMSRQLSSGGLIYGAAQQTAYYGKGASCGTCLRLHPTEQQKYGNTPATVVVINECPGTCHGLDLEVNTIEHWLKRPRVGQLGIQGEVVRCNFKHNGIFIEVFQMTTTKYDARFNFRGNSGPIKFAEMACSGSTSYLPMVRSESDQFTLVDQGKAPQILSCPSLDFRLTSFADETVILSKVPNKLNNPGQSKSWFKTRINFSKT